LKRILVIEHDASIRNNLVSLLMSEGYDATGAPDGRSGIISALENPPDLVLCDSMMMDSDGHRVLSELRANPLTTSVTFIVLGTQADHDAKDVLIKPYTNADVLHSVRAHIAQSAPLSDSALAEQAEETSSKIAEIGGAAVQTTPNREWLHECFSKMREADLGVMVLGVAIDHFGDIVAGLTASALDELLHQTTRRLDGVSNELGGVCVYIMGETFVLLLPGNEGSADVVAKSILSLIRQPFHIDGTRLHLSASVGVACYPDHADALELLVGSAHRAVSKARASGGDTWHLHNPALELLPHSKLDLSSSLFEAVDANELFLVYQPQVSLQDGTITGFEALIRWNRGTAGVVSPAVFIPLAEENGAILEIGGWVVKTAARQLKSWLDAGLPNVKMSVNISPRQLRQDGLAEMIREVIADTGVPAGSLGFEVTESALVHDFDACKKVLQDIRDTGAGVSMDDFGTGYCGLGYLGRLPFDTLKIDRSFISGLPSAPDKLAIVPALIQMARALGLHTIAEGVETVEELRYLQSVSCDQMQGYLFSRPLSAADCTALLVNGTRMNLEKILSEDS